MEVNEYLGMEEDDLSSLLFSNPMGVISDISCHEKAAISSSSQCLPSAWSQSSYTHEISTLNANANTNILLAQAQGDDGFAMPAEDVEVKRSVLGKRSLPEEFRDNDTYSASLMNLQSMTAGAPSPQNNVVQGNLMNLQNNNGMTTQSQSTGTLGNGNARPRVRARRGQATDPHSIAERLRRERIADRMKSLQELVPNANKTDKASMLDEIIDYVGFLQMQVKVLSMSRLGGGGAIPSQGSGSQVSTALSQEGLAFEQTVASLLESDMTTAMQLLQNKGLCLMPMALVTAMSSSTKKPVSCSGKTGSIHDTSSSEKHTLGLSESTCSAIAGIGAHRFNSGSIPGGSSERSFQ